MLDILVLSVTNSYRFASGRTLSSVSFIQLCHYAKKLKVVFCYKIQIIVICIQKLLHVHPEIDQDGDVVTVSKLPDSLTVMIF